MVSMVLLQKLIQSLGIAELDIFNQCVPDWGKFYGHFWGPMLGKEQVEKHDVSCIYK
jgi:hypothetical protein